MQSEIKFYCYRCRSYTRLSYRLTGTPERAVLPGAVLKCGVCKNEIHIEDLTEKDVVSLSNKRGIVYIPLYMRA